MTTWRWSWSWQTRRSLYRECLIATSGIISSFQAYVRLSLSSRTLIYPLPPRIHNLGDRYKLASTFFHLTPPQALKQLSLERRTLEKEVKRLEKRRDECVDGMKELKIEL